MIVCGDPSKEGHKLTAVTHAKAEGIGTLVERLKLGSDILLELEGGCPAWEAYTNIALNWICTCPHALTLVLIVTCKHDISLWRQVITAIIIIIVLNL